MYLDGRIQKLATKYKENEIRLFYKMEQNPEQSGYHTHFLLWFTEQFDPNEGSMTHILKEINLNPNDYCLIWKM